MASLLEGAIKRQVAAAFKGRLLRGTLRRKTSTGLDGLGDETGQTAADYAFEGIRENYDQRYAAVAGIPVSDVSVLIIAGSIKPATTPEKDDLVLISGLWHQVRAIPEVDPAGATYRLQCFVIAAP